MTRRPSAVALVAFASALIACAAVLAGPVALPSTAAIVAAHSGLVAVVPPETGSGDLRLVFSEAIESRFSGADLVAANGTIVGANVGCIDPSDTHVMLVAELHGAGSQELSVAWRALSAADGHVTTGTFPIPGGAAAVGGPGVVDSGGHGGGHLSLEVLAKILAFGGLLVARGLFPLAGLVVAPAREAVPRGLPVTQANALIVGAVGGTLLLAVTELELAAAGTVVDPLTYVAGNRIGALLALRAVIPLAGGLAAAVLIRRGAVEAASGLSALAALGALCVAAFSGHAAAYASPVPSVVDLVHLAAASVWLAGLVGFAGMIGGPTPLGLTEIRAMVPRFSALALTSIALLALSGAYAAWISTGDWTRIQSPYSLGLAIKVTLVAAAFGIGAVNYLDGGRDLRIGGGISRRIVLEAGIAATVIVATASLTANDPPALTRAVPIAAAGGDAGQLVSLGLAPGRAGPNLVIVGGPVPVGAVLELMPVEGTAAPLRLTLESLDGVAGAAAALARADPGGHVAATTAIPAGRWEASVVPDVSRASIGRFAPGSVGTWSPSPPTSTALT